MKACRATNRWCSFHLIDPLPPTAGPFDLIYLYSVFSHLPEEMHWALPNEFHRLLAPGGLLIATTWSRDYMMNCKSLRQGQFRRSSPPLWVRGPTKRFQDTDAALAAYDRGEFCYEHYEWDDRWFWEKPASRNSTSNGAGASCSTCANISPTRLSARKT
jgi:SAM-dependent methyltransferase